MKKTNQNYSFATTVSLARNYLKMSFRSLSRNRLSSSINLLGLITGFFASILIAQYAMFELNFDTFHENYRDIYRVSFQRFENNQETFYGATTFLPVGTIMKEEYPEVSDQCRLYYPFTHGVINYGEQSFFENKPVFADASFFDLFSFELLVGDGQSVLDEPNKVVLSESLARKYFGSSEAIGKLIRFSFEDGEADVEVAGIMEDARKDSHIQLDMLISMATLNQWPIFQNNDWSLPFYHTYIRLDKETDISSFEEKAVSILTKYRPNDRGDGFKELFLLQPLADIHLDSDLTFELGNNGDRQAVQFLILVAVLILLVAYLNYINFTTALSSLRGKEIGISKVMGSNKRQLIPRFIIESLLLNLVSLGVALILIAITMDWIVESLEIYFELSKDHSFWLGIVGIVIMGATLSSLYPAFLASAYRPIDIIRGNRLSNSKGGGLRKVLISTQFIITVSVIGGMVLISRQTDFLLNKDLGFESNQLLVINAPRNMANPDFLSTMASFENELISHEKIHSLTSSGSVPGRVMGSGTISRANDETSEGTAMHFNLIGYNYFKTFGLEMKEGRAFSRQFQTDQTKVIINEAAVEALGYLSNEEAVGSSLAAAGREFEILGVSGNYHHTSLKTNYEPIVFVLSPARMVYLTANLDTDQLPGILEYIEGTMKKLFPAHPFESFFLDQVFDQEFKDEMQFSSLLRGFSLLAIILASLGLIGLSTFLINQRTREIGIRKVLGASDQNFARLLSSFFIGPMVIGSTLACAVLFYFGNAWLNNFPYRISFQWQVLAVPLVIVLLMTGITLLSLVSKASKIEPAEALKNE